MLGEPTGRESNAALCATHEGAQSTGACGRCGNFVCPLCLDEYTALPDHCEACREREGGGLIAFERDEGNILGRWWQTVRDVLLRPTETFEGTRPGSVAASAGFTALTGIINGVCLAVAVLGLMLSLPGLPDTPVGGMEIGIVAGGMVSIAVLIPIMYLVEVFLRTCVFHAAVSLLGGDGGFNASFWSMGYLQATGALSLPIMLFRVVPIAGPVFGLVATLGVEIFYALQLTTIARRHHGLSDGRASWAGWSLFVTLVSLFSLCCLFNLFALLLLR